MTVQELIERIFKVDDKEESEKLAAWSLLRSLEKRLGIVVNGDQR